MSAIDRLRHALENPEMPQDETSEAMLLARAVLELDARMRALEGTKRVPGAGEGDAVTYTPKLCESCRKRPATLIFDGDDEPWFCDDCGFPCGDECCGVWWWERATTVLALEKMAAAPEGE
jgi:hypothetical protein